MSMRSCAAAVPEGLAWDDLSQLSSLVGNKHSMPAELGKWLRGREGRLVRWRAHNRAWTNSRHRRIHLCAELELAQRPFTIRAGSTSGRLSLTLGVNWGFTYASFSAIP